MTPYRTIPSNEEPYFYNITLRHADQSCRCLNCQNSAIADCVGCVPLSD